VKAKALLQVCWIDFTGSSRFTAESQRERPEVTEKGKIEFGFLPCFFSSVISGCFSVPLWFLTPSRLAG
jgi:hypothetical protein